MDMSPRQLRRRIFRELGVLTYLGLYLLEVLKHVIEIIFVYQKNNEYHKDVTRNKNKLRVPKHILSKCENS